jgi:adenylylsulfate kinase-like enzyme
VAFGARPLCNYQKALKQRQHDTGLWCLDREQYASWKTDDASLLWQYGIPGSGKTILSSTILQTFSSIATMIPDM